MYKLLSVSSDATFPFRSIWNPCVPSKVGFFLLGKPLRDRF